MTKTRPGLAREDRRRERIAPMACAVAAAALALAASQAAAQLPPETVTVTVPPAPNAYRLYVSDPALGHLIDGRVNVYDGASGRFIGLVSAGFAGHAVLSPDGRKIYVATTYHARGTRGERTDVLEVHDAATLAFEEEIVIPPRHAQALPYTAMLRVTPDGRFALVQNATPAVSVTVVDLAGKRVAAEIATPGCWGVFVTPGRADRFATLCGDGAVVVHRIDARGMPAGESQSARLFDADADPLFVHAENVGDIHYFLSFKGMVHPVDFSGEQIRVDAAWSLLAGRDKRRGWRPGGYQLSAAHRASQRMFVAMHSGGAEGSHKNPASEIWVFDLKTRRFSARMPGNDAIALTVSQGEKPQLFVLDGVKGQVLAFDAMRLRPTGVRIEAVGETPVKLEMQP
jgi:methylamine dehydrogenase heavy chain